MKGYFFLVTSLPQLHLGNPLDISWDELTFLLTSNLDKSDYNQVKALRLYYDLENIRSFWSGFPLSRFGNFNEVDLEQALVARLGLPSYVYDFMARYDSKEERLKHFSLLFENYFEEQLHASGWFLTQVFKMVRDVKVILTALRAKTLGKDLLAELQFQDPQDSLIADILAQKDAKSYDPPEEYQEVKHLYETHSESPLELQKALLQYQFRKVDELIGLHIFTLDAVLSYVYRWILVERWSDLDQQKGKEIINSIVQGVA
ncbi:MAG: DUF2764 family protein [Parachlamydiaceae bacterium]